MKRITIILALATRAALAASPVVTAAVPAAITIQGRFTDNVGNNVADGVYTVAFRIYDDPIAGNTLWSETLAVQVTDGLYTVQVGTTSVIPANLFSSGASRFLGITVNLEPEMSPRIRLSSGAYAYQAQDADVATLAQDLTCVGCVSAGEIAADAVGSAEIAADAIRSTDISAGAVGTSEVADGSLTAADIASDAIGSSEIAPAAVVGGLGGDIADNTITADDLGTNSVGVDEIATSAVGALEITDGTVGSSEIATGAVGTSEVANGSLSAIDIDDEPGVASNTSSAVIEMDGTVQILVSRIISAPAAGYVLAIATAEVTETHTFAVASRATFGVSTTVGSFNGQNVLVRTPTLVESSIEYKAVTVLGLFTTSGGLDTYYFLGWEADGDFNVYNLQLMVIYFPTAYGSVVSTAAASAGEITTSEGADTGLVSPESGREPVQSQVEDQPVSKLELAVLRSEMEARIQKLEEQLRQIQPGAEEKR